MSYAANQSDAEPAPIRAVVAGMWPSSEVPERGSFVRTQVDALRTLGAQVEVAPLVGLATGLGALAKYRRLGRATRRAARATRAQLVHGHYLFPTGWVVRRAARRLGLPYVVTAHGTDVANARASAQWRRWIAPVLRDASGIIAVGPALAEEIAERWPDAAPAIVAHMGVDTGFWTPPTDPHLPGIRVVAVGNLTANKNHGRLIEAFAMARDELPDATLTIIGSGALQAELRATAERLGIGAHVDMPGRLAPERVREAYETATVACLVSEREGYGIAGLEALACGVPLVVSNTAPVSDLVEDAVNGAVVSPSNVASITRGLVRAAAIGAPCEAAVAAAASQDALGQAAKVLAVWQVAVDSAGSPVGFGRT